MWLKPQNLLKCTHGKSLFSCVSFTQFPYLQQTATVIGLLFILLETFTRHTGQLFVCLLSELGLKCLYLRPLWGYELRYVLITPISHHHLLLSVFNLIRFYSFSPWMFFFSSSVREHGFSTFHFHSQTWTWIQRTCKWSPPKVHFLSLTSFVSGIIMFPVSSYGQDFTQS